MSKKLKRLALLRDQIRRQTEQSLVAAEQAMSVATAGLGQLQSSHVGAINVAAAQLWSGLAERQQEGLKRLQQEVEERQQAVRERAMECRQTEKMLEKKAERTALADSRKEQRQIDDWVSGMRCRG